MRSKGFTLVELLVVISILAILSAILLPVFGRTHCGGRASSCRSQLKQISLGFLQYAQDYDGRFPRAGVTGHDKWAVSLQPYFKSWRIYQCPTTKRQSMGKTDYFFNQNLTSASKRRVVFPKSSILAGEGSDDSALNYSLADLPEEWRQEKENTPAMRHYEAASYAFVGGHVKSLKPAQVTLDKPSGHNFTFLTY